MDDGTGDRDLRAGEKWSGMVVDVEATGTSLVGTHGKENRSLAKVP